MTAPPSSGMFGRPPWAASFLIVLALHLAVIGGALSWSRQIEPQLAPPPLPAMMIDLAPLPDIAEAPRQKPADTPPPWEPAEQALPEALPVPKADLAAPVRKKPVARKPAPRPVQPQPPEIREQAEVKAPNDAAQQTAAPVAEAPRPIAAANAMPADAAPNWQAVLLAHLERHKRYPRSAQSRRQQGVAYLRFSMDGEGNVLSLRIERGSGHAGLDEAALDMVTRAQPLPPSPDRPGEIIEIVVPVQFFLH